MTLFPEEDLQNFIAKEHKSIQGLATDKESMLQILNASKTSPNPYSQALTLYPELLRDGYAKTQLKDIKRRRLFDAKSGAIKCENKRLFAIPDLFAACEYYFLNRERPKGLLENGEVACRPYRGRSKVDVLRSPH